MYKKIQLFLIMFVSSSLSANRFERMRVAKMARDETIDRYTQEHRKCVLKNIRTAQAERNEVAASTKLKVAAVECMISGALVLTSGSALIMIPCKESWIHDCRMLEQDPIYQNTGKICIASLAVTCYFLNKIWPTNKFKSRQ
jgi:hypothetical protein